MLLGVKILWSSEQNSFYWLDNAPGYKVSIIIQRGSEEQMSMPPFPAATHDRCVPVNALISGLKRAAEYWSRKIVVFRCVRKIEAGTNGLMSPSQQVLTACAFRASGTTAMISFAFRI